jgi:shikimate kinase
LKNKIILIGYMGCGKSSVGKSLSRQMQQPFLDTDSLIEQQQGISISRIFADRGEEAFRQMETDCLRQLLEDNTTGVIAAGGGLPLREVNRELLKQLGQVIYLKARPETIYERLKGNTTRPLLQTADPRQRIEEMMQEREEKYRAAADRIIQVDGYTVAQIVSQIIAGEKEE